jgi:sialate O-acetylesterase
MKIFNTKLLKCTLLAGLFFISMHMQAKIVLPSVFSNHMVIQQKTNAAIWGKGIPNHVIKISTTWSTKTYASKSDKDGKWKILVSTPAYGGPYSVTISDGTKLTLQNILIGDVWVCSGQSNMEMPLAGWGKIKDYQEEIAAAKYPDIRLLQVNHVVSNMPLENAEVANGGWMSCTPENISGFSSTAYFFAREVYKKTGIPIGLIHTSWGGTIAEAWTSRSTLKTLPDFAAAADKIAGTKVSKDGRGYQRKLATWQKLVTNKDKGYVNAKSVWAAPSFEDSQWKSMLLPEIWEQAGLPDFDGVVWFRKKITLPQSWAGKPIKINLGMIDDHDVAFFNGEQIGETDGYDQPRVYTIPAGKVKAGEVVLTVRVFDSGGGGGIYGGKNALSVTSADGETISLDGEWKYQIGLNLKNIAPMPVIDNSPNRVTVLYNAMINPFIQFSIRGAIWYQGESNADRAVQYEELFPAMIRDWRRKWNIGDFPFYFVQLANYMKRTDQPGSSAWAELRDAQLKTLAMPNTGMSVSIDIGEEKDIHPKNKQEVGRRLGLIALAKTYGKNIAYSGPKVTSSRIVNNSIILNFNHTDGGLAAMDGKPLRGFAIAGADQKFYWATATINGTQVIVSAPEVSSPVAVRYAWADNPEVNFYNGAGLPASPFRTDNWRLTSYGKK